MQSKTKQYSLSDKPYIQCLQLIETPQDMMYDEISATPPTKLLLYSQLTGSMNDLMMAHLQG
jgi:hypothetical protein